MKMLFKYFILVIITTIASKSWSQPTQPDNVVIANKLRFYYFDNVTSSSAYLVSNSDVRQGTESGAFWSNSNMALFHSLIRALLQDSGGGGNASLQSQVATLIGNSDRPIMIHLWNDSSPFNSSSVRATNKPCQDSNRYVDPCSSSWVVAQNPHWSGFMHLGIHYPTNFGLEWFENTFLNQLLYTLPGNGFRILPVTSERNRLRRLTDGFVRSAFGINGGARVLASNISFLSRNDFISRLSANPDFVRAWLVNYFASNPIDDRTFNSIKRQSRIIQFSLSRARTFVDAGMQRGYFEQHETFGAPSQITTTGLTANYVAGFTTSNTSIQARQIVLQEPSLVETLTHEMVHFYTHNNYNNFIEQSQFQDVFIDGVLLTQILKEGVTELFSREVMHANYNQLGTISFNSYQGEVEKAMELVFYMGHSNMVNAFFRGDRSALTQLEQAITNIRSTSQTRTLRNYLVQLIIQNNTEQPIASILRQARIMISSSTPGSNERRVGGLVDTALSNGFFSVYNTFSQEQRITPGLLAEQFLHTYDFQ